MDFSQEYPATEKLRDQQFFLVESSLINNVCESEKISKTHTLNQSKVFSFSHKVHKINVLDSISLLEKRIDSDNIFRVIIFY